MGKLTTQNAVRVRFSALAVVLLCLANCAPDEARREYFAALRGDEDGSTRAEQLAHIDRAIELAPQRASYWETRAGFREDDLRFLDALADLDRAIELADRPYLRFRRGLVRCRLGEHSVALPDFDAAIAGQPENAQFFRGRALARIELGLVEEATKDAETYFELAPQRGEARYVRGRVFAALGRHREAVVEFDETLRIRPELIYPLFARAASLEALGERELAAADRELAEKQSRNFARHPVYLDPFRY